jgi:hypothetical protein
MVDARDCASHDMLKDAKLVALMLLLTSTCTNAPLQQLTIA